MGALDLNLFFNTTESFCNDTPAVKTWRGGGGLGSGHRL